MTKIPSKTFTISFKDNSYTTENINQGHLIDFENYKLEFSNYMINSITNSKVLDIIYVDAAILAFFPKFKQDLKIGSIKELGLTDTKDLIDAMQPFFGWYVEWENFMREIDKVEEIEKDEK